MRWAARISVGLVSLFLLVGGLVVAGGPATAQVVLSPGCQALNDPLFDRLGSGGSVNFQQFFAGETVTVTARAPFTGNPTGVNLLLNNAVVQTAAFPPAPPGTSTSLSFTFNAPTVASVGWSVSPPGPTVTFEVVCQGAGAYPLGVSVPGPASYQQGAGLELTPTSSSTFPVAAVAAAVLFQVLAGVELARRRRRAPA